MNKFVYDEWYNKIKSEIIENINFKNGIIQEINEETAANGRIIDVKFQNSIHFIAELNLYQLQFIYYISRNNSLIGQYHIISAYEIKNDSYMKPIRKFINEISDGKYNNKKSCNEKLQQIIAERNLVSYMNSTKWNEFLHAMTKEMPAALPYDYKRIDQEPQDLLLGTSYDAESFNFYQFHSIEWVKVQPAFDEYIHKGNLMDAEKIHHDYTAEFLTLMNKYSIPLEYDENDKVYIIYGYK